MRITSDVPGDEVADGLDVATFAELYSRYRDALYGFCRKRTNDPVVAEDIVQEVFEKAFARRSRFQPGREFWPWLSSIAARACIDAHRRQASGEARELRYTRDHYRRPEDDTAATVLRAIDHRQLGRVIAALPPRQRAALELFALDQWSYEQIARHLGYSDTAVKALIRRARTRLRDATGRWVAIVTGGVRAARWRVQHRMARAEVAVWPSFGSLGANALSLLSTTTTLVGMVLALAAGSLPSAPSPVGALASATSPAPATIGDPSAHRRFENPGHGADANGPSARPPRAPTAPVEHAGEALAALLPPEQRNDPEAMSTTSIVTSPGDSTIFAGGAFAWHYNAQGVPDGHYTPFVMSHDDGTSWVTPRAVGLAPVTQLLLPPAYPSDHRLFAATTDGLFASSDDGESFVMLAPLPAVTAAAISPRFDEGDPVILMVAGQRLWQYRSDTGLLTPVVFEDEALSLANPVYSVAYDPDPASSGTVIVGRRATVHGTTALAVSRCAPGALVHGTETTSMQCASNRFPTDWPAQTIPLRSSFGSGSALFAPFDMEQWVSVDGGRSFTRIRQTPPGGESGAMARDMVSLPSPSGQSIGIAQVGWGTSDRSPTGGPQFVRTDDGGQHWTGYFVDVPGFDEAGRAAVTRSGRIILGATGYSGVVCSVDGGRTWGRTCPRA